MFTDLEFQEAMQQWPEVKPETIEYRWHYDRHGKIYLCTQQQHPKDTDYVVVDASIYDDHYNYRVVDGKPKIFDKPIGYRVQLIKSDQGYQVIKGHAGIILENEEFENVEYYDNN